MSEAKFVREDTQALLARADRLINEHQQLVSKLGEPVNPDAVTNKIAAIQADIQSIKEN